MRSIQSLTAPAAVSFDPRGGSPGILVGSSNTDAGAVPSTASMEDVDTALLTLPVEFVEALRALAPTRRRSRIPHVVALGVLAVVAVLGSEASTREFGLERVASVTEGLRAPSDVRAFLSANVAAARAAVAARGPAEAPARSTVAAPAGIAEAVPAAVEFETEAPPATAVVAPAKKAKAVAHPHHGKRNGTHALPQG